MPGGLSVPVSDLTGPVQASRARSVSRRVAGMAMVEVLVALLVFAIGMLGLASAQLGGKRAGYDALQRSVATALAGDMLERVRANPLHAAAYAVSVRGEAGEGPVAPEIDCDRLACTGAQLAAFDLWQWYSLLLGTAIPDEGAEVLYTGTLRSPNACILAEGAVVEVVITWLALSGSGTSLPPECGTGGVPRHQLRLVTVVGRP